MQFSDTGSNRGGLIQLCETLTGLGDTGISGNSTLLSLFTSYINIWYHKTVSMILAAQDDWDWDDSNNTDYPVATTPLVSAQRDYTLPASLSLLKVKRVDITYDNSTYYKAEMFDPSESGQGLGNDTNTDARFTKSQPYYDLRSNAIWIYPTAGAADVSAGGKLRIEFFRDISEFVSTDTTKKPGIDTPFHTIIGVGASAEWCLQNDESAYNSLNKRLQDEEARLKQYYGSKTSEDRRYIFKSIYNEDTYGS